MGSVLCYDYGGATHEVVAGWGQEGARRNLREKLTFNWGQHPSWEGSPSSAAASPLPACQLHGAVLPRISTCSLRLSNGVCVGHGTREESMLTSLSCCGPLLGREGQQLKQKQHNGCRPHSRAQVLADGLLGNI